MSAVNVYFRDGQDLHLTVYHPSLNRTQIEKIKSLEQKSVEVTTNAGLLGLLGVCFLISAPSLAGSSLVPLIIMSALGLAGGVAMYLMETLFWYRKRMHRFAEQMFLQPHEMRISVTVPSTSSKLQQRLYDLAVVIRDKKENKKETAALYKAVVAYRMGEPSLDTQPMSALMEAV